MKSGIHASEQDESNGDNNALKKESESGNKIVDTLVNIIDISDVVPSTVNCNENRQQED